MNSVSGEEGAGSSGSDALSGRIASPLHGPWTSGRYGNTIQIGGCSAALVLILFSCEDSQGEASLAVFAAYIKDTKPACAVAKKGGITYVVCYAMVGKERLDLANILITSGYAFAALNSEGMPYHVPYAVAEQIARDKRAGLWQFEDVQHPAILLSREVNARTKKAEQ